MNMGYIVDLQDGKWSVYYEGMAKPIVQDAPLEEVYVNLATIIEYDAKVNIVRTLMTFPHGFMTKDGEEIVHEEALRRFDQWFSELKQFATSADELHQFIDDKIYELLV